MSDGQQPKRSAPMAPLELPSDAWDLVSQAFMMVTVNVAMTERIASRRLIAVPWASQSETALW